MSAQIVVDISSDEEDNASKTSTKTRSTGRQPTDSTRIAVKSPSRISPTADRPTIPAKVTAGCSESIANIQPRRQSTNAPPAQTEQEATKDLALSAPQTAAASTSSFPAAPTSTPEQEPPKPTPLDINEFRHLVSAGSIPAKDSPLIMSIQPVTPATHKRKATETLENHHLSRRPSPSPLPPTPYTGTSEHPVPPKSSNSILWSVPAYKPPPPTPSSAADSNHSQNQTTSSTKTTTTTTHPPPKQPSIPNIHAPLAASSSSSTPTTTTTTSSPPQKTKPPTPTPTPKPPPRRRRESKWTGAQLANLASAIEAAFFPTVDAFAAENKKTGKQVREAYSFLVNGRIFEFVDGAGDGRNGKGTGGRGKVARRFEREMREDRKSAEKIMKQVHRKEASEGHWASEGMPKSKSKSKPESEAGQKKGGRGRKKGVLGAAVGVGEGGM